MQNGTSVNGSVSMILRLTTADGATHYWTSGQTTVAVSSGAFRYPLGTPNESAFAAIDWAEATPYVELTVNGNLLTPREPLLHVPYSLLADALKPGATLQAPVLQGGDARHGRQPDHERRTPISGTDAANKAYVDSAMSGSAASGSADSWTASGLPSTTSMQETSG